jgi:hypothetical protein
MTVQIVKKINFETFDATFPLLEELLRDMKEQKPVLFRDLDWTSLSSVRYWSHNFVRDFFEFFNINYLVTYQMFSEEFLIEIIEVLIPKCKIPIDVNIVIKTVNCIYKNVTPEFKNKYTHVNSVNSKNVKLNSVNKVKKTYTVNKSFENIINYIQDNDIDEYNRLDLKAVSSFKLLSEDFISRHFEKLDLNMIFTHQKLSNSFISLINDYNGLPFNCLLISHIRQLTLEFLFQLDKKVLKNPKYLPQIQKRIYNGNLNLTDSHNKDEKYFFRNKTGINDDSTLTIISKKNLINNTSLDTFFLDGM